MKHMYQDDLKPFLRKQILSTVNELDLTNEQAAEALGIDVRSFAYFKAGKNMCSSATLIIYLANLCPNPMKFIEEARLLINKLNIDFII